MPPRRLAVAAALAAAGLLAAGALVAQRTVAGGAHGSALSRGPEGWLGARRYLEARGATVTLLVDPAPEPPAAGSGPPGVAVVVFPWQRVPPGRAGWLRAHLAAGGVAVLAYSGRFAPAESELFDELGCELVPRAGERHGSGEENLAAEAGGAPLRVPAPGWLPRAPERATVLYRAAGGEPAVWTARRGRGRLVVLPATALDNAGLAAAGNGNADLLETLRAGLGDDWRIDEAVHGLVASPADDVPGRVYALAAGHLAVLYLAGLWALGRRFGAPWKAPVARTGSTAAVLTAVGGLHHRLGHHAAAAHRALERSAALLRRPPPEELTAAVAGVGAAGFTPWIARLARWRRGGPGGRFA